MQLRPLTTGLDQLEIVRTDGDAAYFMHLLSVGEFLLKLAVAGFCSSIEDDSDRHRYRQTHRLVRSDGIGEWAQSLNEILTGVTSQHLCPEVAEDKRELTTKCQPGAWQFGAVSQLDECLRKLNGDRQGLPAKVDGLRWFSLFAELRNATRGHGALKPSRCAELAPPLERSIRTMAERTSLFGREWAHLYRNLSGKYRVTWMSKMGPGLQELASTRADKWGHLSNGAYVFMGRPRRVELLFTDADLTDYYVPNGKFNGKTFEAISYISDNRQLVDASPYLTPATQLPPSETQGLDFVEARGETFSNIPGIAKGYVGRPKLEDDLSSALLDERRVIVTLSGRGGIGKTSLALQVLHRIAQRQEFSAIFWFSSRDVDLLPTGPRQVRPHLLNERDLAKQCKRLLEDLVKLDDSKEPLKIFSDCLFKSPLGMPICFVFDNFETVNSPVELYRWIDTFVRQPNKVLITTRQREFRADFPIEITGMEEEEASELIRQTASQLQISDLITQESLRELYRESEGHPYVLKVFLGEAARLKKFLPVQRVIANKDEILDALFERTYARLSPAAQQVFLTLSSWRSIIPRVALEAVLLRPANERMDIDAAIREIEQCSFIEISTDNEAEEEFIAVPLAAAIFGKRKLQVSPFKASVEANMEMLLYFGAGQRSDVKQGLKFRIERFFRTAAHEISVGKQVLSHYVPVMEYIARRYPAAWRLLATLYEEGAATGWLDNAMECTRRYIEGLPASDPERKEGWGKLALLARRKGDARTDLQAQVEIASSPDISFDELSNAINKFNGIMRQQVPIPSDEKRILAGKLLQVAQSRISEADATDYSRLAWLCLLLGEIEKGKEYTSQGLALDPDNEYCLSLGDRFQSQLSY